MQGSGAPPAGDGGGERGVVAGVGAAGGSSWPCGGGGAAAAPPVPPCHASALRPSVHDPPPAGCRGSTESSEGKEGVAALLAARPVPLGPSAAESDEQEWWRVEGSDAPAGATSPPGDAVNGLGAAEEVNVPFSPLVEGGSAQVWASWASWAAGDGDGDGDGDAPVAEHGLGPGPGASCASAARPSRPRRSRAIMCFMARMVGQDD
jgi:hypothetical protein